MREVWKEIPGFEGRYYISSFGRCKSVYFDKPLGKHNKTIRLHRDKLLTPSDNGNGYLIVHLCLRGKRKVRYVHRLVADAFLWRSADAEVVNHIDFDKRNNHVDNLEWCTQLENVRHSSKNMKKQKKSSPGASGIRYLHKTKNGGFRVVVDAHGIYKCFRCFEEAMTYRAAVLREIGYSTNA